jgi:hypothetical protein
MRRLLILASCLLAVAAGTAAEKKGCFGTAVDFVDSPKDAAKLARKDEKLVFVLHISGHFEDPKLT